jgi:hypothetical protein
MEHQKNAMKCNKTQSKWCINKHGASKIIDTFETYHLTADSLAIMVKHAIEQGLITGLASKNSGGVSILQYVDDTILLFEDNLEQVLLCLFEEMCDRKINFHKSDFYCVGQAKLRVKRFEEVLTCKSGYLPMKYLGSQ